LTIGYWLCTAVLALVLVAPVLAVARTAVLALVLYAPVLAVARTAVLALVLYAPVHEKSLRAAGSFIESGRAIP
jgi:hypothetical protein